MISIHLAGTLVLSWILKCAATPIAESDRAIFITRSREQLDPCLKAAYFGSYGGHIQDHIFLPRTDCLALTSLPGSIAPLLSNADAGHRILWIGQAGVDPRIQAVEPVLESWNLIQTQVDRHGSAQHPLSVRPAIQLLHHTPHSLLIRVSDTVLPIIDTLLPSHLVPVALPLTPAAWDPVPKHLAEKLAKITKNLTFSPEMDKILADGLILDDVRRNVRWLTGEGPSGIESRHSFTAGAKDAAKWIKAKVEATGAQCTLQHFLDGFSPNVICQYPSLHNSTDQVILSAHYDSRGSFGQTRAPGGDDDGSGTGHLLAIAEAIASQKIEFEGNATLAFFAGEEQGLLGSHAYAEYLRRYNATVSLQVQADMLGYHDAGEPMQIGFPETIGTPEATWLLGNISQLYSPELVVGTTAACCSDHQSFVSFGFPATQVFERNGWIIDPMYHNSGDVSGRENYDFEQIVSIAKVTFGSLLTVAGYRVRQ